MGELEGRTVLITGGSRGIGAATARLAASRGAAVAITFSTRADAARAVVAECETSGVPALAIRADVTVERDVVAAFDVASTLGTVDVCVNNAGILHEQMRVDEMSVSRWREVFDVNVIGTMTCAREAVRRMSTRHGGAGGAIVNVSSIASVLGSPEEYVDYAASKGAIDSFTIGLGREVAADGIRVNAVRPGVIHTDIHALGGEPDRVERVARSVPMRRGGDPGEVAETILWLASDRAAYVTAALIDCSGGR